MTLVVKLGGAAGADPEPVLADLARRRDWILVHGGSDDANRLGERLGHPPRFVQSPSGHASRFTDAQTLEIFTMALANLNARLVASLRALGANAIGLSGADGGLLVARRKETVRAVENGKTVLLRGDHTGVVEDVNVALLSTLLSAGYAPVVTLPAVTREGVLVNADGDRVAARIASAMKAQTLVVLTNVPGLLERVDDPASLVPRFTRAEFDRYEAFAAGRMKKKLLGAREAIEGGVPRVVLASANVERPVEKALAGEGTVILP
ncbi:MAG TPA: [LysW]-aminoadipate kinase [Candidatus Thermoplasmatota archaeon]|nr:[LysW]-aminoadipate kinase [Candidatus Thermoplasmatota archaeon]